MNIHNEVNYDEHMILFTLLCLNSSATEYLINHINLRLSYTNFTGALLMFTESGGTNVCSYLAVVKRKHAVLLIITETCRQYRVQPTTESNTTEHKTTKYTYSILILILAQSKESSGDVQELKNGLDFIKISYFLLNKRAKFKEKMEAQIQAHTYD